MKKGFEVVSRHSGRVVGMASESDANHWLEGGYALRSENGSYWMSGGQMVNATADASGFLL